MKKVLSVFTFAALLILFFVLYRQDVAKMVSRGQAGKMAAGAATAPAAPTPRLARLGFVSVARVIDGDTIDVWQDGYQTPVRFIGINSPETVDPRKPVECFGPEASQKMHQLLDGEVVRLETDPGQDFRDKYGRLLAYVYLPDGTDVNELMIQEGFAREYTYKRPYKLQKEFKVAEAEARSARLGLWAPGVCP